MGVGSGAAVSRYERLARRPSLETALACQAALGVPVHELFPGIYAEVEQAIIQRARLLAARLREQKSARSKATVELLEELSSRQAGGHKTNV